MMRWITLVCVLIVAVGAMAFVYQTLPEPVPDPTFEVHPARVEGPPPKLEIGGGGVRAHQFGTMLVGGKGSHAWEFRNTGRGALDVWVEETSCSCTVATLGGSEKPQPGRKAEKGRRIVIPPGETSPIEVDWEARRPGRFAQAATLGTSDPDNPSVVLSILGKVIAPVEVRPSEAIGLSEAPSEQARRTTVEILSHDRAEMKLLRVSTSRPGQIVAEPRPLTPAECKALDVQAGYALAVEVKPGLPPGRFSEEVRIETNHPKQPSISVRLTGNTLGPITVVPPRVDMPSVVGVAGASQDLTLIVRGGRGTNIELVSKPEKIKVAITPEEKPGAGRRYRLSVTVPPGSSPGWVHDPIVLKTEDPSVKELRIPVSIYISTRSSGG